MLQSRSVLMLRRERFKSTMAVAVSLPQAVPASLSGSVSTLRSEFKPLWEAILEDNLDSFRRQFRELSREGQIEIVQVCNEGETLLHVACNKAAADIVALLLHTMGEPEIDSDQREELLWLLDIEKRWTPLHYACRQQRADIVKQLLYPPWPNGDSTCVCTNLSPDDSQHSNHDATVHRNNTGDHATPLAALSW